MRKQIEFTGSPKENLRAMRILTAALSTGVIFFALIAVVINQLNGPVQGQAGSNYETLFLWVVVGVASFCIIAAKYLYAKKVSEIKNTGISLGDKLNQYRSALILYQALCEAAALLSVVIFFLTGIFTLLIITAILLTLMLSKVPITKKVVNELALDWKEQQEFE